MTFPYVEESDEGLECRRNDETLGTTVSSDLLPSAAKVATIKWRKALELNGCNIKQGSLSVIFSQYKGDTSPLNYDIRNGITSLSFCKMDLTQAGIWGLEELSTTAGNKTNISLRI